MKGPEERKGGQECSRSSDGRQRGPLPLRTDVLFRLFANEPAETALTINEMHKTEERVGREIRLLFFSSRVHRPPVRSANMSPSQRAFSGLHLYQLFDAVHTPFVKS